MVLGGVGGCAGTVSWRTAGHSDSAKLLHSEVAQNLCSAHVWILANNINCVNKTTMQALVDQF